MKRLFTFLGAMFLMAGSASWAQEVDSSVPQQSSVSTDDATMEDGEDWIPSISLDSRFGYNRIVPGRTGGFGGDGLYLNIDGKISKNFSYSLCQKFFSAPGEDDSVFDNTDWLTLSYNIGNFTFTAGKDVLMLGSYEYDAYDIDSYFDMNSMFYNSFNSYQWGVKAMWTNESETTSFAFQVTTSPFSEAPREDNIYSYNLGWYGSWDCYESIWTANFMEYDPGDFVKVLAVGNMFYMGNLSLGVDCILRGTELKSVGKDITVNFMPSYDFDGKVRLFGKLGWERNRKVWDEGLSADEIMEANAESYYTLPEYLVADKDYWFYGAGVEYYPIESVRLHAAWASNNYTSRHTIDIGLTWKFDVVKAFRRIGGCR